MPYGEHVFALQLAALFVTSKHGARKSFRTQRGTVKHRVTTRARTSLVVVFQNNSSVSPPLHSLQGMHRLPYAICFA
jgi:hypothetical protein